MPTPAFPRPAALLALALLLSACAGPRPDAAPAPSETVAYPDAGAPSESAPYEPAPVYEPAPAPGREPAYDAAPAPRQVDGFRVQVYASETAAGGDDVRAQAQQWWTAEQQRTGFQAPLDAYVVYLNGLYKVRMGAFTNRSDAESALSLVRTRFPDAFLVPDAVTVDG